MTEETEGKDDEHQFFYAVGVSTIGRVAVTITNQDDKGLSTRASLAMAVPAGAQLLERFESSATIRKECRRMARTSAMRPMLTSPFR